MGKTRITLDACVREIVGLHDFFQQWLEGSVAQTESEFARFAAATAADFTLVSPAGSVAGREETGTWIYAAHGSRQGFRLWTEEHVLRAAGDGWALVTYREGQTREGNTRLRLSTVLFTADPAAPSRLLWRHVHETWLTS